MWRKFSIREFAAAGIARLRFAGALVTLAVVWIGAFDLCARGESKDWIVLSSCRLIANPANDGDSFHVSAGDKEYIFRLYLVDAPETDARNPARLVEQAKYFGVTVPQVIEVGEAAKEFTQEKLSAPFTVLTRMSDAMGSSRLERFYAFVETKQGDLGEQLVRNGLARNYGFRGVPPGLGNARIEMENLQQFEDQAKEEKIGGWGVNVGRLNIRAQKPPAFNVFAVEQKSLAHAKILPNPRSRIPATPTLAASPASIISAPPTESHSKEKIELRTVDINTATEKELRMVPGIGPVIAARIIAARPFRTADDLKKVNGIGDKNYAKIRPYFQ